MILDKYWWCMDRKTKNSGDGWPVVSGMLRVLGISFITTNRPRIVANNRWPRKGAGLTNDSNVIILFYKFIILWQMFPKFLEEKIFCSSLFWIFYWPRKYFLLTNFHVPSKYQKSQNMFSRKKFSQNKRG